DVRDDRPAAHVAVRAVDLLPQVLDARRVLAVEQLEQGLGEDARDLRLAAGDLAPAEDLVVGLDPDVGLGADGRGLEGGDLDAAGAVGDGLVGRGGDAGHGQPARGGDAQHFAAVQVAFFGHDAVPPVCDAANVENARRADGRSG